MNPRGPPGTPMDIETFPQNSQIKSMERTPFQSLTLTLKIMRKRSDKLFFFFSFVFKHLDFFRKIGQSFLCFSDFPKFTKPAKTFKNTSNLSILNNPQLLNFRFRTHRPQPNQTQYIHIYIYIHLFISIIKTFETSSNPCICFYQKIGLEPDLSRPPTYLVH